MFDPALEYFCLAFLAALGVLQAAASYNGLKGISFFDRKIFGYIFAVFTISPALAGFFTWSIRNPVGMIHGKRQFGFFTLALISALIFTLATSSLRRKSLSQGNPQNDGLEALKETSFWQALWHKFGRRR